MKYFILDTLHKLPVCEESGEPISFDTEKEAEEFADENIAHGFYRVIEDPCAVNRF